MYDNYLLTEHQFIVTHCREFTCQRFGQFYSSDAASWH